MQKNEVTLATLSVLAQKVDAYAFRPNVHAETYEEYLHGDKTPDSVLTEASRAYVDAKDTYERLLKRKSPMTVKALLIMLAYRLEDASIFAHHADQFAELRQMGLVAPEDEERFAYLCEQNQRLNRLFSTTVPESKPEC